MKVGAAVVSCRRGGNTASFDVLNKYFTIGGMTYTKSDLVDAPVIDEFPIAMECEFIEYQSDDTGIKPLTLIPVHFHKYNALELNPNEEDTFRGVLFHLGMFSLLMELRVWYNTRGT